VAESNGHGLLRRLAPFVVVPLAVRTGLRMLRRSRGRQADAELWSAAIDAAGGTAPAADTAPGT
jgi:hypothetical protein